MGQKRRDLRRRQVYLVYKMFNLKHQQLIKYSIEWKNDLRNGFGNLSIRQEDGSYKKIYSGGWKNDKQHVIIHILFN